MRGMLSLGWTTRCSYHLNVERRRYMNRGIRSAFQFLELAVRLKQNGAEGNSPSSLAKLAVVGGVR